MGGGAGVCPLKKKWLGTFFLTFCLEGLFFFKNAIRGAALDDRAPGLPPIYINDCIEMRSGAARRRGRRGGRVTAPKMLKKAP